ncbi:MAG: hypothetical protein DRP87_19470 [Spirochaetes bacterium]|nr:MAG: hypothetical protein DRP87_19470 [Spirochaetota bacterium]
MHRGPLSSNFGIYYTLFRYKTFIELVASEDEENARLIGKNENQQESLLSISVFDVVFAGNLWQKVNAT